MTKYNTVVLVTGVSIVTNIIILGCLASLTKSQDNSIQECFTGGMIIASYDANKNITRGGIMCNSYENCNKNMCEYMSIPRTVTISIMPYPSTHEQDKKIILYTSNTAMVIVMLGFLVIASLFQIGMLGYFCIWYRGDEY